MGAPRIRSLSVRSRQNLTETMKEEALAFARYMVFAREARKDGRAKLASLLEKRAEQHYLKHFTQLAELLGLLSGGRQDVCDAVAEDSSVVDVICKLFAREARQDGDHEVAQRLREMHGEEAVHRLEFVRAVSRLQARNRSTGKNTKNTRVSAGKK
jgi:rubrerythrin